MKRKKRTVRWDRVATVCAIPLVALVIWAEVVGHQPVEYENRRVVVKAGDTLWDIAKEAVGETEDVRQAVYDIQRRNGLATAHITPGMVLTVRTVKHK